MRPLGHPLLADENIQAAVIAALREQGRDVVSVGEVGLSGRPDVDILAFAHEAGRVVLTHDRDFGTLAIRAGISCVGIIYVRPAHIRAEFTLDTLAAIRASTLDVTPPFLLVAERRHDAVRMRLRQLAATPP